MSTKRDERAAINFYPLIKDLINNIFSNDNENYIENPMVDIESVAKKLGIKDIQYVSPSEINTKHPNAHAYIDLEQLIIYVNSTDRETKQRFSIAHEIFHAKIELINEDGSTLKAVARKGNTWKEKNAGTYEAVGEDIADYFAANLLVPTDRFLLWEDKTSGEIAKAFGVEDKCIEARRIEIEHELRIMAPKNLASGVTINDQAPLSLNELDTILEGCRDLDIKPTQGSY